MSFRPMFVALAVVGLALPATASLLEQATSGVVAYQFDGSSHHDAPDGCTAADPAWSLAVGETTDGILVPPDDVADVYVVEVPRKLVGSRLAFSVDDPTHVQNIDVDAFVPDCAGSIQDLVNWPTPEPSPPAPAVGEQQVAADVTEPFLCNDDQWGFAVDGLQGFDAPASIHLAWTDGTEGPVTLDWESNSFAVYGTDEKTGILLKGAWINLPAAWEGEFHFAVGNCDAVDGGAVYGQPPSVSWGSLEFTPVKAGAYLVQVSWRGGALPVLEAPVTVDPSPLLVVDPHDAMHDPEGAVDLVLDRATSPQDLTDLVPGMSVPATCHFCLGEVEDVVKQVSYFLRAGQA